jgi:hypothetical protein
MLRVSSDTLRFSSRMLDAAIPSPVSIMNVTPNKTNSDVISHAPVDAQAPR